MNPGDFANLMAAVPAPGIKYSPQPLRPSAADLVVLFTATLICIGPRNLKRFGVALAALFTRRGAGSGGGPKDTRTGRR